MKSITVQEDNATRKISHYAEKLRDLVLLARSDGIQLVIAPTEDKPEMATRPDNFVRWTSTMLVPYMYVHPYLDKPLFVQAIGVIDGNPNQDGELTVVPGTYGSNETAEPAEGQPA